MSAADFTGPPDWDFKEQSPKGKESYLDFKKRMNELLASQPKDGISNVRGPIKDTIKLPVIPFPNILDFCNPNLSRDDKTAFIGGYTYYVLDEIGALDVDAPPFAVENEPFLIEGFKIHHQGESIVNPAETIESGEVALVRLDGNVFMKWVTFTPQGFELSSRSQSPISVPGEFCLLDRFRILGKIMGALQPVKRFETD